MIISRSAQHTVPQLFRDQRQRLQVVGELIGTGIHLGMGQLLVFKNNGEMTRVRPCLMLEQLM